MESAGAVSQRCLENAVNETSIPVPVLNWQSSQLHAESVYLFIFVLTCFLGQFLTDFKGALCNFWGRHLNQKRKIFIDLFPVFMLS